MGNFQNIEYDNKYFYYQNFKKNKRKKEYN